MSNEFAISAITITLRNLLDAVKTLADAAIINTLPVEARPLSEIVINNLPLDEASEFDNGKNQVNIFLYHIEHNAAWRNTEIPGRVKSGESGHPPLGLNLYYLITAFGQDDNEIIGHLLLGKAMTILHDHPVFSRQEIQNAFPASQVHEQIERVRIIPQPISLDDMSKLWTGFQTQYKLSVAYQVSVLLIESKRPSITPLPVLTRGADDRGVFVQPFVIPPYPTLESVRYPRSQTGVQPGDELILAGHDLKGTTGSLKFKHLVTGEEILRAANVTSSSTEVRFTIPSAEPAIWPPGLYTASSVIGNPGEPDKTSNEISFAILPAITLIQIQALVPPEPKGYLAIITTSCEVRPQQRAFILLGNREFPSRVHTLSTTTLRFEMRNVEPGDYFIRLRVDGIDSLLIDDTKSPPIFNVAYKKTLV